VVVMAGVAPVAGVGLERVPVPGLALVGAGVPSKERQCGTCRGSHTTAELAPRLQVVLCLHCMHVHCWFTPHAARHDIANKVHGILADVAACRLPKALSVLTDIIAQSDPNIDPHVRDRLFHVANAGNDALALCRLTSLEYQSWLSGL
jgi:hypothetical protein